MMIADDFGAIHEALGTIRTKRAPLELPETRGLDLIGIRHGVVRLDGEDDPAFWARLAAKAGRRPS